MHSVSTRQVAALLAEELGEAREQNRQLRKRVLELERANHEHSRELEGKLTQAEELIEQQRKIIDGREAESDIEYRAHIARLRHEGHTDECAVWVRKGNTCNCNALKP